MSRAKMIPFSGEQVMAIFRATGLERRELAEACGVGASAIMMWMRRSEIPAHRIATISALVRSVTNGKQPSEHDLIARRALGIDPPSEHNGERAGSISNMKGQLPQFTTEALVAELTRRGWKVALRPREEAEAHT
jgi:hypothetical protein